MSVPAKQLFKFGAFQLDPAEHQLRCEGRSIALSPKGFEMLLFLVERSGRLIGREELLNALWPDSHVEETNLTRNIWMLRQVLGESDKSQSYIETIPKRGYRFIAPVRAVNGASDELVVEKHSFTRVTTNEQKKIASLTSSPIGRVPKVIMIASVSLLLVGSGVLLFRSLGTHAARPAVVNAATAPTPTSIAVLPFKIIGAKGDDEYLGLGLTDALITKLGNEHRLIVRPTSAVRRYTNTSQETTAIGREQRVDAVLDGSVQRNGDQLRLTVQLIRVSDGTLIWSGNFDEHFSNIFAIQNSISDKVACDLVTRICGSAGERHGQQQISADAFEAYLRGRYFWNKRTGDGYKKAVEYFSQAIERDASYALAYDGLADAYLFFSGYSGNSSSTEAIPKARAAARKAIELDGSLAEPHATLGLIAMNYDWDWQTSEQEYKRAIELNPNYATAHHWYGEYFSALGRFDEANRELKQARDLDPLSLIISTDIGKMLYYSRKYDEAIDQLRKTLEMDPTFFEAHFFLSCTYAMKGLYEEALADYRKAMPGLSRHDAEISWLAQAGVFYALA